MTEKRFTLHKGLDTLNIMDNTKFNEHIYINKSSKDMELLVGVLNAQHEEIIKLQSEIKISDECETLSIENSLRLSDEIVKLEKENEQLKKELLFFYDVANCECSTNWKEDMEKGCKRFFNCTYEEAKEKYGDYDGMWWELND